MRFVPFSQGLHVLWRSLKDGVRYEQPQGPFSGNHVLIFHSAPATKAKAVHGIHMNQTTESMAESPDAI